MKVVKRDAVKICKTPVIIEKNLKQKAEREIVSTISDWINEFREGRRKETKQALDHFSVQHPQI